VLAALGAVTAIVLIALALDVLAVSRDLSDDDFRFQSASTRQRSLWNDLGLLPGSSTVRALGLEDDSTIAGRSRSSPRLSRAGWRIPARKSRPLAAKRRSSSREPAGPRPTLGDARSF